MRTSRDCKPAPLCNSTRQHTAAVPEPAHTLAHRRAPAMAVHRREAAGSAQRPSPSPSSGPPASPPRGPPPRAARPNSGLQRPDRRRPEQRRPGRAAAGGRGAGQGRAAAQQYRGARCSAPPVPGSSLPGLGKRVAVRRGSAARSPCRHWSALLALGSGRAGSPPRSGAPSGSAPLAPLRPHHPPYPRWRRPSHGVSPPTLDGLQGCTKVGARGRHGANRGKSPASRRRRGAGREGREAAARTHAGLALRLARAEGWAGTRWAGRGGAAASPQAALPPPQVGAERGGQPERSEFMSNRGKTRRVRNAEREV